jgi:hypothetical protein
MTLMKSFWLGSAAGLVAVAGAQAADLPTKKGPPAAEYVKICSIAGVTGFILPGSDTCLKISGGVGIEFIGVSRTTSYIPYVLGGAAGSLNTWAGLNGTTTSLGAIEQGSGDNPFERYGIDGRAWVVFDTASNTAMGPLTAEAQINANTGNSSNGFDGGGGMPGNYGGAGAGLDHAWFKWAGLEGHIDDGSLFNVGTNRTFITDSFGAPDIGGTGWLGYVGHFGGGFIAGVSIEDANGHIQNGPAGFALSNSYHYSNYPDFAAKIGVAQGWGSAYLSGIIHNTDAHNNFWLDPNTGTGYSTNTTGWGVAAAVSVNATPAIVVDVSGNYTYGIAKVFTQGIANASNSLNNAGPTSYGVGVYGNGAFFLAQDAVATPTGYGIAQSWGLTGDVKFNVNPSMWLAVAGTYGSLTYSADPIVISKSVTAWSVGGEANWSPVTNLNFDLDIMYTAATSAAPTGWVASTVTPSWNKSSDGFLGRLQIARTF